MCKKSRFRGPFDKQHGKLVQALLKSASQLIYQISGRLPRKFSWKRSVLLTCKILGLLVNTLGADEKHPVLKRQFNDSNSAAIISETKNFFSIFCCFSEV